jgi:site-specific recombinase XerD
MTTSGQGNQGGRARRITAAGRLADPPAGRGGEPVTDHPHSPDVAEPAADRLSLPGLADAAAGPTLAQAVELFLGDLRQSPRTVKTYRQGLGKFLAYLSEQGLELTSLPVTALTIEQVIGYVTASTPSEVRRPDQIAALRTVRTYLAAIRRFYTYLAAFELHPTLATDKLTVRLRLVLGRFSPPLPNVRSRDLERLIEYAAASLPRPEPARELARLKTLALLLVLRSTGLRVSELCALFRQEIDLERGTISVYRGKGGKSRVVRLDSQAATALAAYWRVRGDALAGRVGGLPAFSGRDRPGQAGQPISARTVQALVARLGRAAGLETTVTPHSFRHGLATELVRRRVRESVVQRLLGHASPATTQLYVHLVDQEVEQEYQEAMGEYRPPQ